MPNFRYMSHLHRHGFFLAICIIVVSIQSTQCAPASSGDSSIVQVSLPSLPEAFEGSKLPNFKKSSGKCLQYLDCIEKVPQFKPAEDPRKMETEFRIYAHGDEQYIPYQPTLNCLAANPLDCRFYPFDLSLLHKSKFNPTLPTIIIIGGYRSKNLEPWQTEVKDIWNKLSTVNVIIVSWAGGNRGVYDFAADEGFSEQLHLIGHSLGAHIAGYIGQDFGGKIGRITGLDPAGPLFTNVDREYTLDKTDAIFVDALHTNGGTVNRVINLVNTPQYGMERTIGHMDYYANNGKHQPDCMQDFLGCSHNKAIDYYTAFLEHEVNIREDLKQYAKGGRYHDCHRLFAYKSDTYGEFVNGKGLSNSCPSAIVDETDLYMKDINHCSVPMDFVTPFGKLRKELEAKYNLDLNSMSEANNKYYFYTKPSKPFLNNHILIKVRVSKEDGGVGKRVCDIVVETKMAGGMKTKVKLPAYELLDEGDHYEVILPFLSPNTYSKYELARLDANDYFLEENAKLKAAVTRVFPTTIDVHGVRVGTPDPDEGFLGALKNFLNWNSDKEKNKPASVERHECSLNVELVTVKPLKKLHRLFAASYSIKNKYDPDFWFMMNDQATLPNLSVPEGSKKGGNLISRTFLDTVIVGPFDSSMDPEIQADESDGIPNAEESTAVVDSSSISGATWLTLTVMTIIFIVIISTIMLRRFLSNTRIRNSKEDKAKLVQNQ